MTQLRLTVLLLLEGMITLYEVGQIFESRLQIMSDRKMCTSAIVVFFNDR